MKHIVQFVVLFCFLAYHGYSAKLPGPLVYVVTPSSKPSQTGTGRASPFYYRNWMRRMDNPDSIVPSSTTTVKTPDLIFAEFESGHNNLKSIKKLLDKEKFQSTTTTTSTFSPIYVPDEEESKSESNLPQTTSEQPESIDMTDYFALYNNLHNSGAMYVPSAPSSGVPTTSSTTPVTTTTTEAMLNNVENIWHIIDNHKHEQFADEQKEATSNESPIADNQETEEEKWSEHQTGDVVGGIDENFALPGFGTNPGNGAENESRAIRTEPNIRFPYVNLKPFIMKNVNSKKANNLFNLDSLTEIKHPIRGEVHDTPIVPIRQPIDRYNPAQPYLPKYGTKSKQSGGGSASAAPASPQQSPMTVFANLVPPPPPAAPQITADDFPTPSTYESFPPYAPGGSGAGPSFSFPPSPDSGPDSSIDYGDDSPSSYKYKAPPSVVQTPDPSPSVAPASPFIPTLPPLNKPFSGYSYDKPPNTQEDAPTMDMNTKPVFQGYNYNKPAPSSPPSQPSSAPGHDYSVPNYEHHDVAATPYHSEPDYPELVFDKPHGMGDMKGGDTGKDNDMGMMPPPLADTKPDQDHGFPHDFPGGFNYGHDFEDHDYHHHHHHPTTTTTSTTEQPRVNRYSYYYLGKKLYYLPLYFSVYFIVYVGALIIKAILRHKITYPNSFRPNDKTASFFSKRSIESHLSIDNLHEMTGRVANAIAAAAEKYINEKSKES